MARMKTKIILLALPLLLAACETSSGGGGGAGGGANESGDGAPGAPQANPVAPCSEKGSGAMAEVTSFGDNPGNLKMHLYAPARLACEPAVVVALHGCTQDAKAYVGAGWNEFADKYGFVVVHPEQQTANNANRCFNWYEPAHTKRDAGEPRSIAAMVQHAKGRYGAARAFVTGLSAGVAMTAVMLATYPDLFEAGAIVAGLPYGCADSMVNAFGCMNPGKTKSASEWASLARSAGEGPPPRVQIWHGSADYTVRPSNLTALEQQWTGVNDLGATPTRADRVGPADHRVFADANGAVRVESFLVANMAHGTPLGASPDGTRCGQPGAYLLDAGVCSTFHAVRFFGRDSAATCGD
jgi:poly(hydroxyalkanoate) depolymerase family esterase